MNTKNKPLFENNLCGTYLSEHQILSQPWQQKYNNGRNVLDENLYLYRDNWSLRDCLNASFGEFIDSGKLKLIIVLHLGTKIATVNTSLLDTS